MSRTAYITSLFGVPKELKVPPEFSNLEAWSKPVQLLRRIKGFLLDYGGQKEGKYDPAKHKQEVYQTAAERFDQDMTELLTNLLGPANEEAMGTLTMKLADPKVYTQLVESFFKDISENKTTHYLIDPDLYNVVTKFFKRGSDGRLQREGSTAKFIWANLASPEGAATIERLIEEYKFAPRDGKPFQFAFIPHLHGIDNRFLKDAAEYVLFSTTKRKDGMRHTGFSKTDTILLPHERPLIVETAPEQPSFTNIHELPLFPGRRLAVLSHLNVGHLYTDDEAIHRNIEVINAQGPDEVVVFSPIETPHFRLQTDRRKMLRPEYQSLDEQLRGLHRILAKIDAPVTLVIGEDLLLLAEAIKRDYADAVTRRERETGQEGFTKNRGSYNQLYYGNSIFDPAYHAIEQVLIPFLLRLGRDPWGINDTGYEGIIEAVDACNSVLVGRSPGKNGFLDETCLHDSAKLRVAFDKTVLERTNAKLFSNPNFSSQTQYSNNPTAALEDIVRAAQNGTLAIPEEVVLDGFVAHQGLRILGKNHLAVWTPHMLDDAREFQVANRSTAKPVLTDPSHRRNAVGGWHNHNKPGSNIIVGGLQEGRLLYKPLFPRVIANMDRVQRSGQGYNYYSVFFLNDTQFGSLTERPESGLKAIDYWLNGRDVPPGTKFILCGIGDYGQFRNYPMMPIENATLGAVATYNMQQNFTKAYYPWLTDPRIVAIKMVPGNHEWNTDKLAQGAKYMEYLQGALMAHKKATGSAVELHFPDFVRLPNGDVAFSYMGSLDINNLPGLFKHSFTVQGAGKGSATRPSSIMESFKRQMGELVAPYTWLGQGHYHIFDVSVKDNTMNLVAGGMAGISGFELDRQYGGDSIGPTAVMLDFTPDGSMFLEAVTDKYLNDHEIRQPEVAAMGLERHIMKSFGVDVHSLKSIGQLDPSDPEPEPPTQKLYHRQFNIVSMTKYI